MARHHRFNRRKRAAATSRVSHAHKLLNVAEICGKFPSATAASAGPQRRRGSVAPLHVALGIFHDREAELGV